MTKRRRGFSLLEILISISIASILFGVLFSKVREFSYLRITARTMEAECLQRQALQIRLQELFSSIAPGTDETAAVYSQSSSLHFQIEHPLDIDPAFTGKLQCSLSQENGQFVLNMFNDAGQTRREILGAMKSLSWKFFSQKEKTWMEAWSKTTSELPAYLSLTCHRASGDVEYLFPMTTNPSRL